MVRLRGAGAPRGMAACDACCGLAINDVITRIEVHPY